MDENSLHTNKPRPLSFGSMSYSNQESLDDSQDFPSTTSLLKLQVPLGLDIFREIQFQPTIVTLNETTERLLMATSLRPHCRVRVPIGSCLVSVQQANVAGLNIDQIKQHIRQYCSSSSWTASFLLPDQCHSPIKTTKSAQNGGLFVQGLVCGLSNDELSMADQFLELQAPLRRLAAPDNIIQVACGPRHSLLRTSRGLVYAFGHGECGRLGLGDERSREPPTLVESLVSNTNNQSPCISIACGREHSVVVCADGSAFAFGWGEGGRLGIGTDAGKVVWPTRVAGASRSYCMAACGREHSLLLTVNGEVYFSGLDVATSSTVLSPTYIPLTRDETVVLIAAGDAHSMALTHRGRVYTWGFGGSGALGHGGLVNQCAPQLVRSLSEPVVQINCGHWYSAALTTTGEIWAWGDLDVDQGEPEDNDGGKIHERPVQLLYESGTFQRLSNGPGPLFAITSDNHALRVQNQRLEPATIIEQCIQSLAQPLGGDLLLSASDNHTLVCIRKV